MICNECGEAMTQGVGSIYPICVGCEKVRLMKAMEVGQVRRELVQVSKDGTAKHVTVDTAYGSAPVLSNLSGLVKDIFQDMVLGELARKTPWTGVKAAAIPAADSKSVSTFDHIFTDSFFPDVDVVPKSPPPLPRRKSVIPFTAYRAWYLLGGKLQSVTADCTWDGPVLRSGGKPDDKDPMSSMWGSCERNPSHGIYAFKKQTDAIYTAKTDGVIGEIDLSGKVVVHESGYRAEIATIKRLLVMPGAWKEGLLEELADRYQCDVTYDIEKFREVSA